MSKAKRPIGSLSLLAECAEFLDGIGWISPAFDRQVKDLLGKVWKNSPWIKRYMDYCADCREVNKDSKNFDGWVKIRLSYLRRKIRKERISYGEISELQDLAPFIDNEAWKKAWEHLKSKDDLEMLEWAGVPEHAE